MRLPDVKCPVLWMQVSSHLTGKRSRLELIGKGSEDWSYTVSQARVEIQLLTSSPDAKLIEVEAGKHFLSRSHPGEVRRNIVPFVRAYG